MSLELPGRLGHWGPGGGEKDNIIYLPDWLEEGGGLGNLRSTLRHSDDAFGRI